MEPKIVEIINRVLRDVNSSGLTEPRVEVVAWDEDPQAISAMIYSTRDSTGQGVSVRANIPGADQLASMADQVQEWVIEENSHTTSNWPQCPWHPNNHPMAAQLVGDQAVWACPVLRTPAAIIGELPEKGADG
ncbi:MULTISPECIES: hypothetical protein [Micrococcaceae]|uniref:hypothetical protein n=1 Tax=Micrococcaceae TaxID=1268 RepID=UPI00047E8078|nr:MULTISPECIES: hypothetical protein [Micrococcaceae]BCW60278.1 hypothetical protein StoSoilB20_36250 [Arthrobacter sp. StoSoilB20]